MGNWSTPRPRYTHHHHTPVDTRHSPVHRECSSHRWMQCRSHHHRNMDHSPEHMWHRSHCHYRCHLHTLGHRYRSLLDKLYSFRTHRRSCLHRMDTNHNRKGTMYNFHSYCRSDLHKSEPGEERDLNMPAVPSGGILHMCNILWVDKASTPEIQESKHNTAVSALQDSSSNQPYSQEGSQNHRRELPIHQELEPTHPIQRM